jgi:hypothetical protein
MEDEFTELIPNAKEMKSVLSLNVSIRCEYLVKRISDQDCLAICKSTEGPCFLSGNQDFDSSLPVFPNSTYAKDFIEKLGQLNPDDDVLVPEIIPRKEFIENWIEELEKEGTGISVFPTIDNENSKMTGTVISPSLFREMIHSQIINDFGELD